MIVRQIELGDLDAATLLLGAQFLEHDIAAPAAGLRESIHAVLANPHVGFVLLATLNGKPVGVTYVAALLSLEHKGMIGWLEELFVLPESRNIGIGSQLLKAAISRTRELGWSGIELELIAGHERAAALYICQGFQPLSRSRFCQIFAGSK